jgi:peptidyl-prolyl cis-trans isomerase D
MSVIQSIRDKYARIAVIAIALSLVGFILMDAFTGRSNMFGGGSNVVGNINGKKIKSADFDEKVKAQEDQARSQGYDMGDAGRQQAIAAIWNQEVSQTLLEDQYEKLGIEVSDKEVNDMMFGSNPPNDLKQRFTDSATGQYNGAAARDFIVQMKNKGTAEDREQLGNYVAGLKDQRRTEKYTSLLANSFYFPKWLVEKQVSDNSLIAKVAFVSVPYASISDSAVKVSNDEITSYINAHRDEFGQKEETRSISYVAFSATPTAADSVAAQQALIRLKPAFDSAKNYENFLAQNSSVMPFYDGFISRSAMRQPNKEAILNNPVGVTYGPYFDGGQNPVYAMSRILDMKVLPDTAKVRHILISTYQRNQQTGQMTQVRDETSAKKIADSVLGLLRSGQPFDSLAIRFSEDGGSRDKGGVIENVFTGQMFAPFNDFLFTKPVGSIDIVKTDLGYHIIEVLAHKGSSPAYKIAYFARPIEASDETDNAASTAASQFAADSKNAESFRTNADKLRAKGINIMTATDITESEFQINGLGSSRSLVRDIYSADKGDVLAPQRIGDAYIVATVTDVNKPGVQSVSSARTTVEPILRNRKKAIQIKQSLGPITTLEAVAAKVNQMVQPVDSLHFNGNNQGLGFESRVIGAAFNPANKGKVVPEAIEGQSGVFVLRVDNQSALPADGGSVEDQRKFFQQQARQNFMSQMQQGQGNPLIEPLKADAKITDNRAKFY